MTITGRVLCFVLASCGAATIAVAGGTDSGSSQSTTPSAGEAVKAGDVIRFLSDSAIFRLVPQDSSTATTTRYCVPANYRFEVQTITAASTQENSADTAKPANTSLVSGYFPGSFRLFHFRNKELPAAAKLADHPACQNAQWVSLDTPYQFTSEDLPKAATKRQGFTWGSLVIPYKYYFTDKSIKGNPSTVLYAGYEGWVPGVSLAGVGSAGLGVSTNSNSSNSGSSSSGQTGSTAASNSNNSTSTGATYTFALGVIATFGGSMKAGLMFGRDYQGSGSGFKYENKTWMALSVGMSF